MKENAAEACSTLCKEDQSAGAALLGAAAGDVAVREMAHVACLRLPDGRMAHLAFAELMTVMSTPSWLGVACREGCQIA